MNAHAHTHSHADGHEHPHPRFADVPHPQHVVLELGDGIGALIVHTDPGLVGVEVEISPTGQDDQRQHKEVLERIAGGSSTHVLVFDNLAEGTYTLWIDDSPWALNVGVTGGEVAELDRRRTVAPVPAG